MLVDEGDQVEHDEWDQDDDFYDEVEHDEGVQDDDFNDIKA